MSTVKQIEREVEWYNEVCQRLEALRSECLKDAETEGCIVPPNCLFDHVKEHVQVLMELASFPPHMPVADVWLGPEGEIGLTWHFGEDTTVDAIYGGPELVLRLTQDLKQSLIKQQELPCLLAKLAA
jgi:hypothetical protein